MATNTSGMHLSRRTYVPFFLKPLNIYIYIYPTSFLLVLSTPEKHSKFFGFTRLFDLNMKTYFKTTTRKSLRIPSRTNPRRYIVYHSRLSTLPSCKQQNPLWRPAHQEYTSQGAPIIRTLISPNRKNVYFSSTSPLLVLSAPAKHYKFFGFTKTVWFEHEKTNQDYQAKQATHTIKNES